MIQYTLNEPEPDPEHCPGPQSDIAGKGGLGGKKNPLLPLC